MYRKLLIAVGIAGILVAGACSKRKVSRIDPNQQTDLSGRWNDTDSRLVANEMIKDVLERPWRPNFEEKMKRKPVVIVGTIRNKSHEHIDSERFIKDIEKAFINTNTVTVVQSGEARDEMRGERNDQQTFSSPESMKKWGKEKGADYMMFGVITSNVDEYGKEKVVSYQVNLELTDLETNEKVWIGEKEIKKAIRN